ncbi:MAG: hypothetical protein ACOZNI_21445 [Myxococcota bacterium]
MPTFYTSHLPHLLGEPSARVAAGLTRIVRAVTSVAEDTLLERLAGCPARNGRCRGEVVATRFDAQVRWVCTKCGASGVVTGWEKTPADGRTGTEEERPLDGAVLRGPMSTWPRISGTLTTFARPILSTLPPVPAVWQRALALPATVWNAVVLADHGRQGTMLADVLALVAAQPVPAMLADMLVARKRRLFAADFRTVEIETVELLGDTMWVRVTARDGRR